MVDSWSFDSYFLYIVKFLEHNLIEDFLVCQSERRSLIKHLKSKLNSFDIVMAITRSMFGAVRLKNPISN